MLQTDGPGAQAWVPRPAAPGRARVLLRAGRRALQGGARAEGLALTAAACALDASLFCRPWGLLPHLQAEGRGSLRPRMRARLQSWYQAPRSQVHAHVSALSRKMAMRAYVEDLGLPLPRLYQAAPRLEALDWAGLPERVVVKPQNASSCRGVIVAAAGWDHIGRAACGGDLPGYAQALYGRTFETPVPVMAEELLADVQAAEDPALVIPRDFKVFAAGGHAGFVCVHDRNAPGGKRSLATVDREGRRLPHAEKGWPEAAEFTVPPGYGALIAMAEHLSRRLPWLLRLDFYLTPRGPVFGELTSYPNAGGKFTGFARRTLLQMWELWPD
ncbi:hypothetical protein KUW17_20305 [Leisingera aquaemixtae]|uniref:ATP-grasp fold amidoligase family protein n=1 Tax=Leisingera aquaemixtae TaxID=1396826 RepID=UPI001C943C09|nr:ATP-grasp fold amidoligase family protein [Leisingera aquaemixtae]MBY6069097.1 hypothetical protein [Leisingera aquaemixtae]